MNIYDRLDRYKGLTKQNPKAKFRVIYPDINRIMLASLIHTEKQIKIMVGEREFEASGYITDGYMTRRYVLQHTGADNMQSSLSTAEQ